MEHPGETGQISQLGWIHLLAPHLLHGLLHFSKLLHHAVHILNLDAGPIGNALPFRIFTLALSAGVMERMIASICLTSLPSRSMSFS